MIRLVLNASIKSRKIENEKRSRFVDRIKAAYLFKSQGKVNFRASLKSSKSRSLFLSHANRVRIGPKKANSSQFFTYFPISEGSVMGKMSVGK